MWIDTPYTVPKAYNKNDNALSLLIINRIDTLLRWIKIKEISLENMNSIVCESQET